jgi:hypothetical protein
MAGNSLFALARPFSFGESGDELAKGGEMHTLADPDRFEPDSPL